MSTAINAFFERLNRQRPVPSADLPPRVKGTIRVDVRCGGTTEHWFVTLSKGGVLASRQESRPNAVVSGSQSLFDRLVRGEEQFFASMLRNEIQIEGNSALASYLIRLLPGPPDAHDPRPEARQERAA